MTDWINNPDKRLAVADGKGEIKAVFKEHYELNPETGELEPAEPPRQEWEGERAPIDSSDAPQIPEESPITLDEIR